MLSTGLVTTLGGPLHIGDNVSEVSICVHSDTPVGFFTQITYFGLD